MSVLSAVQNFMAYEHKRDWLRYEFPKKVLKRGYEPFEKNTGVGVMDRDWDNLIILDACRYDVFADLLSELPLDGTLTQETSLATKTFEYFQKNFTDEYPDMVYVSSNPHAVNFVGWFHDTVYVESGSEFAGVSPDTVVDTALDAYERYLHKRFIIHFVQPHHPFIGETKIEAEFDTDGDGNTTKGASPYHMLAKGEVSEERIREAYRDNLRLTFNPIERLVGQLPGKTVITSDHGEMFGDSPKHLPIKLYGHGGPRINSVVSIPWFEAEYEVRRSIHEGQLDQSTAESNDVDESEISERLKDLGYLG